MTLEQRLAFERLRSEKPVRERPKKKGQWEPSSHVPLEVLLERMARLPWYLHARREVVLFRMKMGDLTQEERLAELKRLANDTPARKVKKHTYYKRREQFLFQGRRREPCAVCWRAGNHRHHILPLIKGGRNTWENLIWLCVDCHTAIHPHMQKAETVADGQPR
jgi:hypothetical protein